MKNKISKFLMLSLPLMFSTSAYAAQCELHIWPAERLSGLAYSLGQIKGRASEAEIEGAMDDLLSSSIQLQALSSINLNDELTLPQETRIVEHDSPLDRKTVNKIVTRRSDSIVPCYFELIIVEHKLIEDIVWGDRFQTAFLFRQFSKRSEASFSFRTTSGSKLKILTLPEKARPSNAQQLAKSAIQANFLEYAKNLRSRIPKKIQI